MFVLNLVLPYLKLFTFLFLCEILEITVGFSRKACPSARCTLATKLFAKI
jgi:hypothetical protein